MTTNKEKTESGNCLCPCSAYSTKPRLIAMSTNLEYREEKDRHWNEKEGDKLAKLKEKKRNRELERETKNKGDEFRWKNNMKILKRYSRCHPRLALHDFIFSVNCKHINESFASIPG